MANVTITHRLTITHFLPFSERAEKNQIPLKFQKSIHVSFEFKLYYISTTNLSLKKVFIV